MALLATEHRHTLDDAVYTFRVFTEQERCDILDMPTETAGQTTRAMYKLVSTVLLRVEGLKESDGATADYDFAGPDKGKLADIMNRHGFTDIRCLKEFVEEHVMGLTSDKVKNSDGQPGPLPESD